MVERMTTTEPAARRRAAGAGLRPEEHEIVKLVRDFVDEAVRPVVRDLEHRNAYPEALIETMKEMGFFGLAIPEEYGGFGVSTECFVLVTQELARGWMSLAGAMGGHTVIASLVVEFGTPSQRANLLPRMATGELRAAMALTEPGGGSDLQAMSTTASLQPDGHYLLNGEKTWITNSRRAGVLGVLSKTRPSETQDHRSMSVFLVPQGEGVLVSNDLPKLGYKGVETCSVTFDNCVLTSEDLLGATPGLGFKQMMRGLEIGRIQVAARALGVGQAAFDDALSYAQQRVAFGKSIWQHEAVGNYLADMATKLSAAEQLTLYAARTYDTGVRADLEAGMAKLFASETALQVAIDSMRIHGGYGYSTELDVERYFRDAPLMIIGEGTN
jgi:alkylation response protein AidB-like acyl-CoA dehydrogenase